MKKRTLLTNIFIVVLMVSIVFVLLAFFDVFPESIKTGVLFVSMTLALISVALVDIIFPLIDNIGRFKEESPYKVKTIVKIILFLVAVAFLMLTVYNIGPFSTQFLGIALFCVAYLAQFFIDLDKNNKNQLEEDDEDEDEDDDEDAEEESESAEDDANSEDEFDNSYDEDGEDNK